MDPAPLPLFYRFGVALIIGLFIGLQREYAFQKQTSDSAGAPEHELLAGARTFPLIALVGCTTALLADRFDASGLLAAALIALGLLLAVAHHHRALDAHTGLTTEVAALLTLVVGMLCYNADVRLAAAVGVAAAVLLALKVETHTFARRIRREDVIATLKFAVITVICLPLLPRHGYGPPPFDVLVPYELWWMVVLISGISFLGYVLIQAVGPRRGVGLTGVLGGLASSTAVTLSFAQRSRDAASLARPFALAIVLAWSLMFIRVLVEVAALNRDLLHVIWLPVVLTMLAGLAVASYRYVSTPSDPDSADDAFTNPFRLGPAITFGLLYAIILVGSNAAQQAFGDTGLYVSSVLSGLADVDAITLSMATLSGPSGDVALDSAGRAILLAAASNTVAKGAIVFATGHAALRRTILPGVLVIAGTALASLLLI